MRLLVLKAPRLLEMSVPESLSPRVDWWLRQAGLGLTRKALGKMATKCPEVQNIILHYITLQYGSSAVKQP